MSGRDIRWVVGRLLEQERRGAPPDISQMDMGEPTRVLDLLFDAAHKDGEAMEITVTAYRQAIRALLGGIPAAAVLEDLEAAYKQASYYAT